MLDRIKGFFLKRYPDASIEQKNRMQALVAIVAFLSFAFLAILFIVEGIVARYFVIGLAALMIGMLFLIRLGKAKLVVSATGLLLPLVFIAVVVTKTVSQSYELYMLGLFLIFDIVLTLFIADHPWQPYAAMGIGTLGLFYEYFFRVLPLQTSRGLPSGVDDFIICLISCWLAAFVSASLMRRYRRLLAAAAEEGRRATHQVAVLEKAVEATTSSLKLGSELSASSKRTSQLIEALKSEVERAKAGLDVMTTKAQALSGNLSLIGDTSRTVRASSEDQGSVVAETSAAIEEMTASLKNISSLTESRRDAIRRLESSTAEGRKGMAESTQAVQAMEKSAAAILGIIKVISAVASQTNLLAMNAAIEAAHAGDYGRGFSVVADEIRKLSEETGKNVKTITSNVKETLQSIRAAVSNNDKATEMFGRIAEDSGAVSNAMEEIVRGLTEIAGGTDEIMKGVSASVSSSSELQSTAGLVDMQIGDASRALETLATSSVELLRSLESIHSRFGEIASEASRVSEIGRANEAAVRLLGETLKGGG